MKLKRPLRGGEIGTDVKMVQRALNKWKGAVPIPLTSEYDKMTETRMVAFQRAKRISPASGNFGQASLDELWPYFDAYGKMRYRAYRPPSPVPQLGPLWVGGRSVLDHSCTHNTDGLDEPYPAFDDAFKAGTPIMAPETLTVTQQSGATPGEAFYATGASGLKYWFGHLDRSPPKGTTFVKGRLMGHVVATSIGGGPHVHCGIDARPVTGQVLLYGRTGKGPDYTYGSPSIGEQLGADLLL